MQQKSRIGRKAEQIELLMEHLNGGSKTLTAHRRSVALIRNGGMKSLRSIYLSISTISNLGFYRLLKGTEGYTNTHKRIGAHFKRKLIRRGLIHQCRRVHRVSSVKFTGAVDVLQENEAFGGFFPGRKGVYHESSPIIELGIAPLVGNNKKRVDK